MKIDLSELGEMHPRLPQEMLRLMMVRAALGLQRHQHQPLVAIELDFDQVVTQGQLAWPVSDVNTLSQHDANRITEDGAEAVALAHAHQQRGWRVVRRLQREEHADWLLEDVGDQKRQLIALEVSGVDRGSIMSRMTEKLKQVSHADDVDQRWAGVIGFEQPVAALHSTNPVSP